MEVKNLKDLGQIIDLCRKKGVDSIEIQGIRLSFKAEPEPTPYQKRKIQKLEVLDLKSEDTSFIDEQLRQEAALFWSSTAPEIAEGGSH